jgi:hypothetical protein
VTDDGPCEAEICPSDFDAFAAVHLPIVTAMQSAFEPGQIGLALMAFDGSHFDIRDAHETDRTIPLNRVAESGANIPVVMLYASE